MENIRVVKYREISPSQIKAKSFVRETDGFTINIKFFLLLLLFTNLLNAESIYTLSGIKKVFPVVEIAAKNVPKEYKKTILDELKTTTDDLKIDTTGYSQRSLSVFVKQVTVRTTTIINMKLMIGEQVQRLDNDAKVFGLTYQSSEHFLLEKEDGPDDLEYKFEDALSNLLTKFSEQYKEDNSIFTKVKIDENNFASEMKYETNYKKALNKAKKLHKNVMLILVTNWCPWCHKFEQKVLLDKKVNDLIQKNYIPLVLNKDKDKFPKILDRAFTPIIHLISYKTLQSYQSVVGYNTKYEFLYMLKKDKTK